MLVRIKRNDLGGWLYVNGREIHSLETMWGMLTLDMQGKRLAKKGTVPEGWRVVIRMNTGQEHVVEGFLTETDMYDWLALKFPHMIEGSVSLEKARDTATMQRLDEIEEGMKIFYERTFLDMVL